MNRLNLENLAVEFNEDITETFPIIPRRYTLMHSDLTAELFLTIGREYAYGKTNSTGDHVLGEWFITEDGIQYYVYVQVSGPADQAMADLRSDIFRKELPLALKAIRQGDRSLFEFHPELDQTPITVFFLSDDPLNQLTENWGTFEDYSIAIPETNNSDSIPEVYRILIDEKIGDVTGDSIPDKVSMYGEQTGDSPYISNIWLEITDGASGLIEKIVTEISGYDPTLFLGDFTNNGAEDIKISAETGGSGGYGVFAVYSYGNNNPDIIFSSDEYNKEFQYLVDYSDFYRVSIGNVKLNILFVLDISRKGNDYLSQFYNEDGKLIKPVQGEVLALGACIPIVGSETEGTFDLLALQRIIGNINSDTLGYIVNLLSWNGKAFASKLMVAAALGSELISQY